MTVVVTPDPSEPFTSIRLELSDIDIDDGVVELTPDLINRIVEIAHPEIAEIARERQRLHEFCLEDFGHSIENEPWDSPQWVPILTEGLGTVAGAYNNRDLTGFRRGLIREELIQTVAMALAWIHAIDSDPPS